MGTGTVDLGSAPALAWMTILLDASIKGAVILLIAGALSSLLRRTSAATRHLVWLLAVASLIALPVLSLALPAWRLPILPQELAAVEPVTTPMTETGAPLEALSQLAIPPEQAPVTPLVSIAESLPEPEPAAPTHWSAWLLIIWGTGATAVFLWLVVGTVGIWRTTRRARPIPVTSPWAALFGELAGRLGVAGPARLLQSEGVSVPMIWGLVRPLVLLPADGERWSEERQRIVLLHELAHIRRKDCLTQMVAQLACIIYWFNPLAWLASRRMRIERERACDDLVLAAGLKASSYAGHLLEIARSARSLRWAAIAGVAMARPSNIEGRLLAILDAKRSRRALTRLTVALALIAAVCLLAPLAALRPTAMASDVVERADGAEDVLTASPGGRGAGGGMGASAGRRPVAATLPGATLANGVTVELLAVSYHPSEGQVWWQPDGSPYEGPALSTRGSHSSVTEEQQAREFVFRFAGLPEGASWTWKVDGASGWAGGEVLGRRSRDMDMDMISATLPDSLKQATVRVGLALDSWETVVGVSVASRGLSGTGRTGGGYVWSEAYESGNETRVSVSHEMSDRSVRIVALDTSGTIRTPASMDRTGAGRTTVTEARFRDLSLSQIKEFQFQQRPYRWVEFRNVSLKPGHMTQVQVVGGLDIIYVAVSQFPGQSEARRSDGSMSGLGRREVEKVLYQQIAGRLASVGATYDDLSVVVSPDLASAACEIRGLKEMRRVDGKNEWVEIDGGLDIIYIGRGAWSVRGSGHLGHVQFVIQTAAFRPVMERVVNDPDWSEKDAAIDLDTGTLFSTPAEEFGDDLMAAFQWTVGEGIDAVSDSSGKTLRGLGMVVKAVPNERWDSITPEEVAADADLLEARTRSPLTPIEMHTTTPPATYVFRTREGGAGILQITGFTAAQRGVKIRYKMLQAAKPEPVAGQVVERRGFVRLVVGKDRMTFEGQETSWEELPTLLGRVPVRAYTTFELAVASYDLTLAEQNEAQSQAASLVRQFGFHHLSYIGLHPLGSKGTGGARGCKMNLKQVGLAMWLYAGDHNDKFPPTLDDLHPNYVTDTSLFRCPDGPTEGPSYLYFPGLDTGAGPDAMLVFDREGNHPGGRNVLFMDGHVELLMEHAFQERWTAQQRKLGLLSLEEPAEVREPPVPGAGTQAAGQSTAQTATFGPVTERVVNDNRGDANILLDLDTGQVVTPPFTSPTSRAPLEERLEWLRAHGPDLMAETGASGRGLMGFDMVAIPIDNAYFDTSPASQVARNLALGTPGTPALMSAKGVLPASFIVQTREGGMGVLQIVEVQTTQEPTFVRIRYKMLKSGGEVATPPAPRRILLPDLDQSPVILDLATGRLEPLLEVEHERDLPAALERLGRGDLIYDQYGEDPISTLALFRGASADRELPLLPDFPDVPVPYAVVSPPWPYDLEVTTREGARYAVSVLSADDKGCLLEYVLVAAEKREKTDQAAQKAFISDAEQARREKLQRKITFSFVDTPLEDVVDFIRQVAEVNVVVDQRVLLTAAPGGYRVSLDLTDVPLEDALDFITDLVDLEWTIRRGVVFISDAMGVQAEPDREERKALEERRKARAEMIAGDKARREKLQRKIAFTFVDTPLEDVADFLRRVGDVSIVVDQRVMATVGPGGYRITLSLTDVPLADALDFILDLVGLKWTLRRGVVWVSNARGVQAEPDAEERGPIAELRRKRGALTAAEEAVLEKFRRPVTFAFVDTPLEDVVDFMRRVGDVSFIVDLRVLTAAGPGGYRITLSVTDIPLEDALDFILEQVDLEWGFRQGRVFISDAAGIEAARRRAERQRAVAEWRRMRPEAAAEEKALRGKLQRKVTLSFADTPLVDVVEFLRRVGDVNIVVDQRVLAAAGPGGYRVSLGLTDVPLEDALDFILDLVDLEWTIRRGAVFVSDLAGVMPERFMRIYDVRDLIGEEAQVKAGEEKGEALAKRVQEEVEPETWRLSVGLSIGYRGGNLIVVQIDDVHLKIQRFLEGLRGTRLFSIRPLAKPEEPDREKIKMVDLRTGEEVWVSNTLILAAVDLVPKPEVEVREQPNQSVVVVVELTPAAAERLKEWTQAHVGEHIAVVMNDEVWLSSPIVQPISTTTMVLLAPDLDRARRFGTKLQEYFSRRLKEGRRSP